MSVPSNTNTICNHGTLQHVTLLIRHGELLGLVVTSFLPKHILFFLYSPEHLIKIFGFLLLNFFLSVFSPWLSWDPTEVGDQQKEDVFMVNFRRSIECGRMISRKCLSVCLSAGAI